MTPKHRLFLDEVGHADMKASEDIKQRYLSLTGIVFDLDYYQSAVAPQVKALKKQVFNCEAVILHRREILNRTPPFDVLWDQEKRDQFDQGLLHLCRELEYVVFTTTIDKLAHQQRYHVWQYNPYHYCLECILERYVQWLERNRSQGDVLAEARGKAEDKKLKGAYRYLYERGCSYVGRSRIAERLTSRELKLKRKTENIDGLQIADLLAHPSFRNAWCKTTGEAMRAKFGKDIAAILNNQKYDRSWTGTVAGYGLKWLPPNEKRLPKGAVES